MLGAERDMWTLILAGLLPTAAALGGQTCLDFTTSPDHFVIADHGSLVPIITDSSDPEGLHIAASTFADDLQRVTGVRPEVYNDTAPAWADRVVMVGTANSDLVSTGVGAAAVQGKWEAYDIRVMDTPVDGVAGALVVTGSDKVCASFGASCPVSLTTVARSDLRAVRAV